MKVRFKDGGKVSIIDMPMVLFDAIQKLMWGAEYSFDFDEDFNEYLANDNFICTLAEEEKEALDEIKWTL